MNINEIPRITVVGSLNMDYTLKVDELPEAGETVISSEFTRAFGGKGANQAVAAARMGAKVNFIGALGEDKQGDAIRENLISNGINTDGIVSVDKPTGLAKITIDRQGENTIVVFPGANYCLRPEHIRAARHLIEESDAVILQLEIPLETVLYTAKLASEAGVKVILNPAPVKELPSELFSSVYAVIPNKGETLKLTGTDDLREGAMALLKRGPEIVVVTLGERGCYLLDSQGCEILSGGFEVHSVDTTGAGDCFTGAFTCALLRGWERKKVLDFANKAGALAVTEAGAQNSMISLKAMEKDLKRAENGSYPFKKQVNQG